MAWVVLHRSLMISCELNTPEITENDARRINGQENPIRKDLIQFPFGLLGFEGVKNYLLVSNPNAGDLLWLQMLEGSKQSFLVTPPCLVQSDYQPEISAQDVELLGLTKPDDALVFNIVDLSRRTVNMKAPIVINCHSRIGKQVIPKNADRFNLRHPIDTRIAQAPPPVTANHLSHCPLESLNRLQPVNVTDQSDKSSHPVWESGIAFEVDFWDRFIGTKGLQWPDGFKRRMDASAPVGRDVEKLLDEVPGDSVRVLDVGAGPFTVFGFTHPRKKILLEATDALAKEYDVLLLKHNVVPPVRTMYAEAEKLTRHFAPGVFDFVHARNSIDHCAAPFVAICQMVAVAKIGANIRLSHDQNEAETQNYSGFHQWNFTIENGEFIIRGKSQTFNITQLLSPFAEVNSQLVNRFVNVHIRKLKDLPREWLAQIAASTAT